MIYRKIKFDWKFYGVFLFAAFAFVASASAQVASSEWAVQEQNSATTFTSVAFSPDGRYAAYGRVDSLNVKILDAANGALIRTLNGRDNNARALAFSPDSQYLATGTGGSSLNLNLWRVSDGVRVVGRIAAHKNGTTSVSFSPDGQLLVTCGNLDRTIKLWHVPDMSLVRTIDNFDPTLPGGLPLRVRDCAFSPDGKSIASSDARGIKLRRVSDGALIRNIENLALPVASIAFSPNGVYIAGASESERAVKLWRISDGGLVRSFPANGFFAGPHVAFAANSKVIVAGFSEQNDTGTIEFWTISDGRVSSLEHLPSFVQSISFGRGRIYGFTTGNGRVEAARVPFLAKF